MADYRTQLEMWPEEVRSGYRLHGDLLPKGERPDMRPWGGMFDQPKIPAQAKN
jgi:hypothetical protein